MSSDRIDLLTLSSEELSHLLVEWGQPRFRGGQIWHWIYHALVGSPDEMVNLPKDLRQKLSTLTHIGGLDEIDLMASQDGRTEKALLRAGDGQLIETVLLRYASRNTVCVSTQIGCPLACLFCATGQAGFVRDLTMGEIAAQILHFARKLRERKDHVTNVVFMGMGEPMLNFEATWRAILNLNNREGLALGARRFTVSTAGIVPGIERMARESLAVGLAISLHAPTDDLRDRLVPVNRRYPLERLLEAVRLYIGRTGRRVTFEYALAGGINDSDGHARQTAELLRGLLCHVNLIPLNPTSACAYEPSSRQAVTRFRDILVNGGLRTTVRLRRGVDIQAGCGQLRSRHI